MTEKNLSGLNEAGVRASIDRRRLLQVAGALGLTATIAGRMGAGPAFGADFDMKKFAGTKLSISDDRRRERPPRARGHAS